MHRSRFVDAVALSLLAASTAAAVLAWPALPAELAVQWGLGGGVMNTMSKPAAIGGTAVLAVGSIGYIRLVKTGRRPPLVQDATVLFVGVVFAAVQSLIVAWNLGLPIDPTLAVAPILVLAGGFTWFVYTRG